ncbi:MAG: SurA N-terminal domain-containing protein [Thermovirgaceae bacterium]|nr:SurA N-terminal domain-containing protein [Thermovirgaceae bacterium]
MQTLRTKTRAIMIVVVIVFVVSIFGMYLSRGSRPSSQDSDGDFPVASVGGEKIMASQIVTGVRNYAEQAGQSDLSPESIVEMRKNVLNSIAMQYMLQKEATKQKIKVPETEIDMGVKRIENQFPTKEAFQQYMENSEIRMKDLREQIGMQLAQRMVLDASAGEVEVTGEEAKDFYGQTKDLFFRQPAGFNVMFARFTSQEAADEARKALLAGTPWDEVLKKYEDKTIDFTLSGEPAFVTAREFTEGSLKPLNDTPMGQVSNVLALSDTDVVVLIKQKKLNERVMSFEEVSADVNTMISDQKKQVKQNEYLKVLMGQADIQILDQAFFEVPAETQGVVSGDKPIE